MTHARLGPWYALDECIGRGGMGEVWSARHLHTHTPVAIKIVTDERATDPKYQRAFRREIRAVAGLDHPGIVRVHDAGVVSAAEAEALPSFRADAPYLVMDLLPEGALRDRPPALAWPALRQALRDSLGALAHAHARGVIHRDLKPDNLLWTPDHRVVLTDFGVAHATDYEGADLTGTGPGETAGTPAYMAPEQIKGLWREQGPWTDLYALGCTAWEWACGRPPHLGRSPLATMVAQLGQPLPPLRPRLGLPQGFAPWLHRLLAKHPHARFARAADAAFALDQLGEPVEIVFRTDPFDPADGPLDSQPTVGPPELASAATLVQAVTLDDLPGLAAEITPAAVARAQRERPALPEDWRDAPSQTPDAAGLGLFDLRTLPFVGREAERDALWRALRQVIDTQRPAAALLLGPSGYGKTRLASWLCQRAHATGAATPLRVIYGPDPGPAHGYGAMVRRVARAQGLPRAALVERLQSAFEHLEHGAYGERSHAQALAELIEPATSAERIRYQIPRLATVQEAYAIARRFLRAQSAERPVILHLDDAQWGAYGLEFAQQILDTHPDLPLPVLIVVTARTDLLAERPIEDDTLRRLTEHPAAQPVRIGPLPEVARHTLLHHTLGLSPALTRRIDTRSGGNPLFAVHLVRAWKRHGLLRNTAQGIDLRPTADPSMIPHDLHTLWRQRLDELLAPRPEAHAEALELAAVLGVQVHAGEWRRALAERGHPVPADLVDALLDQGLAQAEASGPDGDWAFAHAMLREAVLARATSLGRLAAHHAACAAALGAQPAPPAARIARHLLGAGRHEEALPSLAAATQDALDDGDLGAAQALIDQRTDLLTTLRVPNRDARWGEGWVHAAQLALLSGHFDRAAAFARRTDQRADEDDDAWRAVRARLEYVFGSALRDRGQTDEARQRIERGLELARQAGEPHLITRCEAVLAQVLLRQGELDAAEHLFELTRDAFAAQSDPSSAGLCELALARIAQRAGRMTDAEARNRQAQALFTQANHRDGLARCANQRGDLRRRRGRLDEAAAAYREALDRWHVIDAPAAVYAQANLALTLVEAGRPDEALPSLSEARAVFRRLRRWPMVAAVTAAALPGHAARADWPTFAEDLDDAAALIQRTGLIDVDSTEMLEMAGTLAREAGQTTLADAALHLARRQWAALKRPDRVRLIDGLLSPG